MLSAKMVNTLLIMIRQLSLQNGVITLFCVYIVELSDIGVISYHLPKYVINLWFMNFNM